jgi:predicted lipid-binding transport protein (Tim44 family)
MDLPMPTKVDYDPQVIEQFAASLYRKAVASQNGSVAIGAMLGAAFGGVPLTSLGDAWPIPHSFGFATLIIGIIVGGIIGYVIGDARSFGYKLQAQAALCQVEIQRNTQASVHATLVHAAAVSPTPAPAHSGNGSTTD